MLDENLVPWMKGITMAKSLGKFQASVAMNLKAAGYRLSGCQLVLSDFIALDEALESDNGDAIEAILEAARTIHIVPGVDREHSKNFRCFGDGPVRTISVMCRRRYNITNVVTGEFLGECFPNHEAASIRSACRENIRNKTNR